MRRRDILMTVLGAACVLSTGACAFAAKAAPLGIDPTATHGLAIKLARALRLVGSDICDTAALRLEASVENEGNIRLHLRRAALDEADARIIAHALRSLTPQEAASLGSFSLSYNHALGDAGVAAIAQSLPRTLREVGLVGCGAGDQGGEALYRWASEAAGLQVLCIEENHFSLDLKRRFIALSRGTRNLLVIV